MVFKASGPQTDTLEKGCSEFEGPRREKVKSDLSENTQDIPPCKSLSLLHAAQGKVYICM